MLAGPPLPCLPSHTSLAPPSRVLSCLSPWGLVLSCEGLAQGQPLLEAWSCLVRVLPRVSLSLRPGLVLWGSCLVRVLSCEGLAQGQPLLEAWSCLVRVLSCEGLVLWGSCPGSASLSLRPGLVLWGPCLVRVLPRVCLFYPCFTLGFCLDHWVLARRPHRVPSPSRKIAPGSRHFLWLPCLFSAHLEYRKHEECILQCVQPLKPWS